MSESRHSKLEHPNSILDRSRNSCWCCFQHFARIKQRLGGVTHLLRDTWGLFGKEAPIAIYKHRQETAQRILQKCILQKWLLNLWERSQDFSTYEYGSVENRRIYYSRVPEMTKEEYISSKLLKLVKERYQYIIVDEINMLEKDLWKRLCLKGRDRYHLSAISLWVWGARSVSNLYFICIHLSSSKSYQLSITDTRLSTVGW